MHTTGSGLAGDEAAFRELTEPYRRELQLHCYRILGSLQDAEDLVQETMLAAWRGLDAFEGRASLRTWLYRIATNRCLNALRDRGRRPRELPMPSDSRRHPPPANRNVEPIWLEPYPDALLEGLADAAAGPEARYETREAVGLAFTAALQQLPPRQRAVLVLRDVLDFPAAEVAGMLQTSAPSVNSALQRARSALRRARLDGGRDAASAPRSRRERELTERFADAFERGDIDGIVALLTDDARLTMPPRPCLFLGGPAIASFYAAMLPAERVRLVATRANGQPAFGVYHRDPHAPIARAYELLVLALAGDRISGITIFAGTGVFPHFGLPQTLRR
jgi:RNA polymerase sigma-70 factor (TIGR02960 family)